MQGNIGGTGVITVSSPNTNSDRSISLPDASGTVNVSGAPNEVPAGSAAAPAIYPAGDTNTGIFFPAADTIAFSEGGVEAMRLDANGRLLVGCTTGAQGRLAISGSGGTTSSGDVVVDSNASYGEIQSYNSKPLYINRQGNNVIACVEGGNLLVGTTTAQGGTSTFAADGNVKPVLAINNTNSISQSDQSIRFVRNGSTVGTVTTTLTATSYNTSSDYRLKNSIAPMTGALAKVAALKPVTYKWNAGGSDGEGFIAHELAEVCPQAVSGEKDAVDVDGKPQYQGIDTSFLVATLTAAIQELKAIVDAQGAEIAALKGQA
jgi:hypothetical protein